MPTIDDEAIRQLQMQMNYLEAQYLATPDEEDKKSTLSKEDVEKREKQRLLATEASRIRRGRLSTINELVEDKEEEEVEDKNKPFFKRFPTKQKRQTLSDSLSLSDTEVAGNFKVPKNSRQAKVQGDELKLPDEVNSLEDLKNAGVEFSDSYNRYKKQIDNLADKTDKKDLLKNMKLFYENIKKDTERKHYAGKINDIKKKYEEEGLLYREIFNFKKK